MHTRGRMRLHTLAVLALLTQACTSDKPEEPPPPENPDAVVPSGTSLLVQVLDTSGRPIPSAALTREAASHVTDGAGRLLLENLAPGRVVARVEARGYAPASVVAELPEGAHAGVEVHLHPLGPPLPLDPATGGKIEQGPVRVDIPAAAIVDRHGEPVQGPVDVTLVPLDPTTASPAAMPAPLASAVAEEGGVVSLESMVMAEVSLSQNGLPLQLAPGARARLELVLPQAVAELLSVSERIPAWWLDTTTGTWREEGEGFVQAASSDPSKLAWVVEVGHFTWWNADKPWTEKNCFAVTVTDESGEPVGNALVTADGVDYIGPSLPGFTGADGTACVDIKRGARPG